MRKDLFVHGHSETRLRAHRDEPALGLRLAVKDRFDLDVRQRIPTGQGKVFDHRDIDLREREISMRVQPKRTNGLDISGCPRCSLMDAILHLDILILDDMMPE